MKDTPDSDHLRKLARTDGLTGCFNRQYTMVALEETIEKAQFRPMIVAASMVDLDHFKRINDVFGHMMGDVVLREVAQILKFAHPDRSTVGRFSGDEFLIISSGIERSRIIDRADTARRLVKRIPRRRSDLSEISPSLTVGVSFYLKDGRTPVELLAAADKALYQGKSLGGDRVVTA